MKIRLAAVLVAAGVTVGVPAWTAFEAVGRHTETVVETQPVDADLDVLLVRQSSGPEAVIAIPEPVSLLLVDLDHLKDVNDRFGHPAGDAVIREVAETIRMTCRNFDFAARYGGEEFAVILPETPLEGAIQTAERIRERISLIEFSGVGHITASIGIANYPVNALGKEDLIRVADRALYIAKNNGRNRVAYFNYQLVARAEA